MGFYIDTDKYDRPILVGELGAMGSGKRKDELVDALLKKKIKGLKKVDNHIAWLEIALRPKTTRGNISKKITDEFKNLRASLRELEKFA